MRTFLAAGQIFAHHQRNLEYDSVVKFAQVKAGELLDFFKTVNQRIAVYKELSGRFGYVQSTHA